MKFYLVIIFSLMCVAHWYVPVSMIVEQEDILASGKVYRFRTAPVDPNDPFRGKYITLTFDAEAYAHPHARDWDGGQRVFVMLDEDADGFAMISGLADAPPDDGVDFFPAEVRFSSAESVSLQFPFDRFYLEESKAAAAETAYAESSIEGDSSKVAYAVVRIKNGKAALEDVRINDRSIVEIVREMNTEEGLNK
jgi:uncharacterized membrane-anchored protein